MSEWKEYKLGDIAIMKNGKKRPNNKGIYPVYGGNGIMDYCNDYNSEATIIVGRVGAYCGCVYLCKSKCWVTDNAISVSAKDSVDLEYLFYAMKTLDFHRMRIGGAQPLMTQDIIGGFDIRLPNIPEQREIVSIIKSLDDKIENNRKINENLEQQAQALFKSWFIDFEPFKDGKFIDSELGPIPQGWRVGTLDEICCFISRGISPKYDETTEEFVLGQTCVRNNIVTLNNARKHRPKVKNEKWTKQWDVLINSTGVGSLGRVGIVYFDKANVAFDSHLTVVRTKDDITRLYVGRNLLNRQLEIENMAVGSTGQTELPRDSVKSMPIIIPTHFVIKKFNELIKPMALQMYHLINENISLSQTRDTVLPKLMSGEIKV